MTKCPWSHYFLDVLALWGVVLLLILVMLFILGIPWGLAARPPPTRPRTTVWIDTDTHAWYDRSLTLRLEGIDDMNDTIISNDSQRFTKEI